MYRLWDFFQPEEPAGGGADSLAWHDPYGLLEKIWLGLWGLLGLSGVVFHQHIVEANRLLLISFGMLVAVLVIPQITSRMGRRAFQLGRVGISIVSAWFSYERAAQFIASFKLDSYEMEMLLADRVLFGGNPSVWTEALLHPVLTEYLQIIYLAYFPMMLLVALALLAAGKDKSFFTYMLAMNLAMITCHLFYVLVPVRSPFLVADLEPYSSMISYSVPLQGLWWTDMLRQQLLDTTTMRYDCFPSGHTMHSLLVIYFGWRTHRITRAILVIVGVSIIFSTIYLRYHYAIDLIAGAGFALFWIWASEALAEWSWHKEPVPRKHLGQRIMSVLGWPDAR